MGALWKAPFREKSCLIGKRLSLPASQSTQGAFHLSELTGQPIPIVMRIVLINNNHPDQSNQGDGFSAKPLGKRLFHFQNAWSGHGPAGQFWLMESAVKLCLHYTVMAFSCRHGKLSVILWTSIRYLTLHFRDRCGAASPRHRNRATTTVLMCEQKPHPVWFSWCSV